MTIRNLDRALHPRSVAVIGAGPGNVGGAVLANIVAGGFRGPVWPVNPRHAQVHGLACSARVADLPEAPDVAIVAVPADVVPRVIGDLGARGCRLAVVVTSGLKATTRQAMLEAARPWLMRVIGPNAVGLAVPHARLDATYAPVAASPGRLGLIAQSGTIATTLLDWAVDHGVGFSHAVSLGDMADVDPGDYLDLLAYDGQTRAILLYLESIPSPRKFLSAARAAARLKPVIAVKAGRSGQAARAAQTHTGALTGADFVVAAALERAGILRVGGLSEIFAAAETVGRFRPLQRARLAIVTNSGGAGVLAADRLSEGTLAELGDETIAVLDAALGDDWSRANPVDIGGGAGPERYIAALEAVAGDREVDAVLLMNSPTTPSAPIAVAEAVVKRLERGMVRRKPVFACWMGGATPRAARTVLRSSGVASYDAPAAAANAVSYLTNWGRAQAALLHVPDRLTEEAHGAVPGAAREWAAEIIVAVAGEGRSLLTQSEAQAVIAAYGIPSPELRVAATPEEAGASAAELLAAGESAVVVKVLSRDVSHKSDFGGVVLDLTTAAAAEQAALSIAERLRVTHPDAKLDGFTVQPMVRRATAQELIVGIGRDPVFGPVILFGAGGVAVEIFRDTAVALPPLDSGLAADLVSRTRVGALLKGFRGRPPADAASLNGALIALSNLAEDFPCLRTLDVNPLLADSKGVLALDARIEIDPNDMLRRPPNPDLAIRPYPSAWRRTLQRDGETFTLRPIRPADSLLYPEFFARTDAEHLRMRFMSARPTIPQEMALRMTQLDYDRDMAFVAIAGDGSLAGVSRMSCDPDKWSAEYALLVRSDLQGLGLGSSLMRILIDYAAAEGVDHLDGIILSENRGMRALVQRLGFEIRPDVEDVSIVHSRLNLMESG